MISLFKTEKIYCSPLSVCQTDTLEDHDLVQIGYARSRLQNSDGHRLRWSFFDVCFIYLHLSSHCGETSHVQLTGVTHILVTTSCLGYNL